MLSRLINEFSNIRPITRCLISAIAGFFFYGGWAYFVNFSYGLTIASKAFFTQGMISFCITLVLTQFMELFFRLFLSFQFAYWITAVGTSLIVVFISCLINILAGTPEVFMTILPGALISSMYTFSYVRFLVFSRERQQKK